MTKGLTNEEKAQYLVDKNIGKDKIVEYWKNKIVSDDLYLKWKDKKKK